MVETKSRPCEGWFLSNHHTGLQLLYLQTKLAASSVLPLPLYVATCG